MKEAQTYSNVIKDLEESQQAERDQREACREADLFLNKRNGQWEPTIWESWAKRPRYTFDQCNPVVDDVMGEIEKAHFAVNISQTGGGSTKEIANHYAGIIRNLENISGARHLYNFAAKVMVGTGISGWMIKQQYRDGDSFQQDLMIVPVANFKDRVWFDTNATLRNMMDAEKGWKLTPLTLDAYLEKWPKGSKMSVCNDREANAYSQKRSNEVIVGEYYYKKYSTKDLALMSNNAVYVIDDDFNAIHDELKDRGITIEDTRERKVGTVYHKHFDGNGFLGSGDETVFEDIPLIPVYANFGVSEDKIIYHGAIEKLMDPQRVLNYAESKKTAESSLKPIEKTWVAKEQATSQDVRNTLQTQNTNNDPIQFYDHAEGVQLPFKPQTPQPDGVLIETASSAQGYLDRAARRTAAGSGEALPNQSFELVESLQNKTDAGNYKYFTAMEVGIEKTATILKKAIPKVYTTKQEMQVLGEDGTIETITIRDRILDEETNSFVEVNNLSVGSYGVAVSAGPGFQNKQQEMTRNLLEAGKINPAIIQLSADVLLNNMQGRGMDKIVERMRFQMLQGGLIPETQMTDEEKEYMAKKAAEAKPDPIAEANLGIAQAELEKARADTADTQSKIEERDGKMELQIQELILKNKETNQKMIADQEEREMKRQAAMQDLVLGLAGQLKTQAETLGIIKDVIGAESIASPGLVDTFGNQLTVIQDNQDNQRG